MEEMLDNLFDKYLFDKYLFDKYLFIIMACPPGHIRIRRDTYANWTNVPLPTLLQGEMGLDTTNNIIKIGQGPNPVTWDNATIVNNPSEIVLTTIFDGGGPTNKISPSPVLDCGFVS